jgi:hypothetical protein
MRSRNRAFHRLCWAVVRAVALYTVEGLAGLGMAMITMPECGPWVGPPDPGTGPVIMSGPEAPPEPSTLSRRERRQWARLARQLQS